jgi:hypothetical protein
MVSIDTTNLLNFHYLMYFDENHEIEMSNIGVVVLQDFGWCCFIDGCFLVQ